MEFPLCMFTKNLSYLATWLCSIRTYSCRYFTFVSWFSIWRIFQRFFRETEKWLESHLDDAPNAYLKHVGVNISSWAMKFVQDSMWSWTRVSARLISNMCPHFIGIFEFYDLIAFGRNLWLDHFRGSKWRKLQGIAVLAA